MHSCTPRMGGCRRGQEGHVLVEHFQHRGSRGHCRTVDHCRAAGSGRKAGRERRHLRPEIAGVVVGGVAVENDEIGS